MATAKEKLAAAHEKITTTPEIAEQIGAVYKFVVDGDGGGTFLVNLKEAPGVTEGDGPADCTIKMTGEDLVAMFDGEVAGQQLFFEGKLQVEGDMGLAVKIEPLLALLK